MTYKCYNTKFDNCCLLKDVNLGLYSEYQLPPCFYVILVLLKYYYNAYCIKMEIIQDSR